MNSKENVKRKIALILIQKNGPVTIKNISLQVQISEKTIRNYLDELEQDFKGNGVEFVRKPNVGVYLKIDDDQREEYKRNLNVYDYNQCSPGYRQQYILKTLFKNKYTYTIQLLADDLYCSKGTIINELISVQKWLEKHGLRLRRKQNQGLWIEGSEKAYRDAMMSLFSQLKENGEEVINNDEVEKLDYRIDYINYKKIKQLFPRLKLNIIQTIIQESEQKLGYYFTDQAFINLIAHIAIMLERIRFKKKIEMEKNYLENIKLSNEYPIAKWVTDKLAREFEIKVPEEETAYISLHMLGAKIQELVSSEDYDMLLQSEEKTYMELAYEIISLVGEILGLNISNDKLLLVGLALHLRPTIVRLKYGLQLRNPMLERVKNEYASIFGATWACNSIFEKRFGISINEDEVAYIAIHIAVAIERLKNKVRTVIVCSSGIGTSQMVAERLKKQLQELEVTRVIPLNYLTDKLIKENDLIISTIPVSYKNEKIVHISTLVDERDILVIRKAVEKIITTQGRLNTKLECYDNRLEEQNLFQKIIKRECCFIEEDSGDYLQIVKKYAFLMESKGFGKPGFCENVLQRETKSSTIIGKGISIPHSAEEYVENQGVCIIKLKKTVMWNDEDIDLILILSLKFNDTYDTKQFFKSFYSVLDNEDIIQRIKNAENEKEIVTLFLNGGNYNE